MKYMLGLNSETELKEDIVNNFDGVGMIRGENLCVNKMQYFTNLEFKKYLEEYLIYISSIFKDKKVWYRTADLVPHQINLLDGCDEVLDSQQYLIGLRGIRRNLKYLDTYKQELDAFVNAYNQNNNLGLLMPFVSSPEEVATVIKILKEEFNYNGEYGIMIEIPSVLLRLDEFEELGVSNYTFGANDMTSMILGADRKIDNYSKNDIAVLKTIKKALEKVHSYGKKLTVAGYIDKEFFNNLKSLGVDIVNIHYNEIPDLFNVESPEDFSSHYKLIKKNYERKKHELYESQKKSSK